MKNKNILCLNILNNRYCPYKNNCTFAHGLVNQTIDPMRNKIFNMIDYDIDLSDVDFINNMEIYNSMLKLTKLCHKCANNTCIGGYNCKFGSCVKKYQICYDDLVYGKCKFPNCEYVHLTKKGLISYIDQENNICIDDEKKYALEQQILSSQLFKYISSDSEQSSESEDTIIEIIEYLNSEN